MGGFLGLNIVYTYAASGEVTGQNLDTAWSRTNFWSGFGILFSPVFSGIVSCSLYTLSTLGDLYTLSDRVCGFTGTNSTKPLRLHKPAARRYDILPISIRRGKDMRPNERFLVPSANSASDGSLPSDGWEWALWSSLLEAWFQPNLLGVHTFLLWEKMLTWKRVRINDGVDFHRCPQ